MDKLYTVKEAAEILGVSVDFMRELIWSNSIDYINVNTGGKYIYARFTRKHIEDFLRKCEVKAG
ncbi:MAG: helix-turn-helix domain-containing protein [Bacillota bacterium]|jgi:excisionase family DNA binding protein